MLLAWGSQGQGAKSQGPRPPLAIAWDPRAATSMAPPIAQLTHNRYLGSRFTHLGVTEPLVMKYTF